MTGSWLWPAGRVSRRGFVLLYVLPVVCLRVLLQVVVRMGDVHPSLAFLLALWASSGAVLLVGLAKRAHDGGHSGAWSLLLLVPVVGWIAALFLVADAGTPGPNAAGPAPLELTDSRW